MWERLIKIFHKYIFADGDIHIIYDLKKMYEELLPIINTTDMKDKIIAHEWHNEATGHCYVDYIPRVDMGEKNGYVKTPLYRAIEAQIPTEEEIREEFPIGSVEKMKYNFDYAEKMKENQYKRIGAFWLRNRIKGDNP